MHCWWKPGVEGSLWEAIYQLLEDLSKLPHHLATLYRGMYPKELKTGEQAMGPPRCSQ